MPPRRSRRQEEDDDDEEEEELQALPSDDDEEEEEYVPHPYRESCHVDSPSHWLPSICTIRRSSRNNGTGSMSTVSIVSGSAISPSATTQLARRIAEADLRTSLLSKKLY